MAFLIYNNVPKPKSSRIGVKGKRKYPFEELEVGQAFFIPDRDRNTMSTHASGVGKELGRKFSTRLVWLMEDEDNPGNYLPIDLDPGQKPPAEAVRGIGVWRDPDPLPGEPTEDSDEDAGYAEDEEIDQSAPAAPAKPDKPRKLGGKAKKH